MASLILNNRPLIFSLQVPLPGYGMGRRAKLKQPISVEEAVAMVKKHLNMSHVRLAKASGGYTDVSLKKPHHEKTCLPSF